MEVALLNVDVMIAEMLRVNTTSVTLILCLVIAWSFFLTTFSKSCMV